MHPVNLEEEEEEDEEAVEEEHAGVGLMAIPTGSPKQSFVSIVPNQAITRAPAR